MMRTPSLRARVVVLGMLVVVVVVGSVNILLYLAFRTQLLHNLSELVEERSELVRAEATAHSGPDLVARLKELGLRATVRTPDGAVYTADPPSPLLADGLPDRAESAQDKWSSRTVRVGDGSTVTVYARQSGVDDTSKKLLVLEGFGLVVATLAAGLLLLRTSNLALRPLEQIAASARRTSRGQRGERLEPDRPTTALGQLATAYDEMLDSLEYSEKRAGDAQLETELLYLHLRQVIETANAAFVTMDESGTITDWNRKAEEVFGWSRRAVVGTNLVDTLVPASLRQAHLAGLRRFVETGEHRVLGTTVEFEALHQDGHLFPVEVSTWVTYIGDEITFNAFLRDISERRKGEEAVGRLGSIVESAQEAIFSTSLDGTITTWNFGAERTYGFTAEEAIGKHVSIIVPDDRSDEIKTVSERMRRGESVPLHETVRRRKDGSELEVAITSSPIFDSWGGVKGTSTIARDVTEQRRMAKILHQTLDALEQALAEARRSEERSRQFLADAAHQLRSPIAGIRACAETLLRGAEGDDGDRLLAELVRETSRAARLITALLRLARLDQDVPLSSTQSDLLALCASEVERTRLLVPHLEIGLEGPDAVTGAGQVDANVVTEILSNLLDNARRHARQRIRVSVGFTDARVQIRVEDDGSGVPDDAVDRIFDRFVSLDGEGGSGLGLAIARGLARGVGGDLTYGRSADGGSAFVLTLPIHSALERQEVGLRT